MAYELGLVLLGVIPNVHAAHIIRRYRTTTRRPRGLVGAPLAAARMSPRAPARRPGRTWTAPTTTPPGEGREG